MVPRSDATKDDRFVTPTAVVEKLYGGAENIWETVMEISPSQEMLVVKRRVAHKTAGEPSIMKGRKTVLKKDVWLI